MEKAVFLDRDGTINIDHAYVSRIEDFDFIDGALEGARLLHSAGWKLVVVTNQSGIGRGYYSEADFQVLTEWMKERFAQAGAPIAGVYFCPHHPTSALPQWKCACRCRKPQPGMLLDAASDLGVDLAACAMIGDSRSDVEAARNAGIPLRILVGKDGRVPPGQAEAATHTAANLLEAARMLAQGLKP